MAHDIYKPENASQTIAEIRRIIESEVGPQFGKLPTEREFCEKLGTGRRTVRNALEALEAEGLIWRRQGKGTFIGQPPDPIAAFAAEIAGEADFLSVMEARIAIEPALAELCARRATSDDVNRLRILAERTMKAQDADTAELWDGSLHRLIARVAGNRMLMASFTLLDEVRMGEDWQTQRQRARTPVTLACCDLQHTKVIDAIAARDGSTARAAMTEHLMTLRDNLILATQDESG